MSYLHSSGRHPRRCQLSLSALAAAVLLANTASAQTSTNQLEQITVTANRSERVLGDVAGTVSVLDSDVIEQNMARDIRDMIRYEPGVTVSGGGRFGLNGFNIRGIGGDRVLTQVDGAPTADEFSFGPNLSARRDFVDVDSLKAVEIIRGPASSLYGSDALGGVVSFLTKDPSDYMAESGGSFHASVKGGYTSEDDSIMTTGTLAAGNDLVQGMLLFTARDGHETETHGDGAGDITGPSRSAADPLTFESRNLLAKLVVTPNDQHLFRITAERFENEADANILSVAGTSSRGVITAGQTSNDIRERNRLSLAHEYSGDNLLFNNSLVHVYLQESDNAQVTLEDRLSRGALQNRRRDSFFDQNVDGIELQFEKLLSFGSRNHAIVYGIDYEITESVSSRLGSTTDVATGNPVPEFTAFPTRDFPLSETTELSFYAQDEILLMGGALRLTPGMRFDRFELDPTLDEIYINGNPGAPAPEPFADEQVSFKLGAVYDLNDTYSVFGQFAQGFRAPPFDAVNVGFANPVGGYTALPNPDLEAESSNSYEVGLRGQGAAGSFSLTAFHNDYENFIESLAVRGFNPLTGLIEFQATNRDAVEIRGIEFKGAYDLANSFSALDGLSANLSVAYARGQNIERDEPLNTIDPLRAVLGLAYRPSEVWNAQLAVTAVAGKERIDNTDAEDAFFATPGFVTVDLLGEYNVNERTNLNFGIFNLTDRKYWEWGDLTGRERMDPALNRLTRPGINASVTLRYAL